MANDLLRLKESLEKDEEIRKYVEEYLALKYSPWMAQKLAEEKYNERVKQNQQR